MVAHSRSLKVIDVTGLFYTHTLALKYKKKKRKSVDCERLNTSVEFNFSIARIGAVCLLWRANHWQRPWLYSASRPLFILLIFTHTQTQFFFCTNHCELEHYEDFWTVQKINEEQFLKKASELYNSSVYIHTWVNDLCSTPTLGGERERRVAPPSGESWVRPR